MAISFTAMDVLGVGNYSHGRFLSMCADSFFKFDSTYVLNPKHVFKVRYETTIEQMDFANVCSCTDIGSRLERGALL